MIYRTPVLTIEGNPYEESSADQNLPSLGQSPDLHMETMESPELGLLLRHCAIPHADRQTESFWSIQRLHGILTADRIVTQLKSVGISGVQAQKIAFTVVKGYIRLFAILLLNDMEDRIDAFIQQGVSDEHLPLVKAENGDTRLRCAIARSDQSHMPLSCFDGWRISQREAFLRSQHRFIPEVLEFDIGRKIKHRNFDAAVVLPFKKSVEIRQGGYGSVTEVEVHPDCHSFQDILQSIVIGNRFALKQLLYATDGQEFVNEVEALKRFNGFVHDHLVTLLMTWTLYDHHYFLFPLAGSNLEDYWATNKPRTGNTLVDIPIVKWISKQVVGLASALNAVHNPPQHLTQNRTYGRHGDIKPENILWYLSPKDAKGILVIADLGLSRINTEKSRSNIPNKNIPFTPGYRPPECDLEGGTISRAYDIWTFGCLLLELVSWALGGDESRIEFEDLRMSPYITGSQSNIFFDVKLHRGGPNYVIMVKESVSQWISKLHNLATCTQYFHDLLDLIESGMVVTLSQDKVRHSSAQILREVETMHSRVMDPTNTYCQRVCPEKREPKFCVPVQAILNSTAKGEIFTRGAKLPVYQGNQTRRTKTVKELAALR